MARYWPISAVPLSAHPFPLVITTNLAAAILVVVVRRRGSAGPVLPLWLRPIVALIGGNDVVDDVTNDATDDVINDVTDESVRAADADRVTALILLALSSAFDTVDHSIMLTVLQHHHHHHHHHHHQTF